MPPFDGTPSRNSPEPLCQKPGLSVRVFLGNGGAKKQTKNYGRGTENGPPKTTTLAVKNEMPGGQKRTPKTGPKKQKKIEPKSAFLGHHCECLLADLEHLAHGCQAGSVTELAQTTCVRTGADSG